KFLLLSFGERFDSFKRAKNVGSTGVIYGSKNSSNNDKRHLRRFNRRRVLRKPRRSAAVFPSSNRLTPTTVFPFNLIVLYCSSIPAKPTEVAPISSPIL